ncbi:hypothetical protein [Streptomyces sp. NPDC048385]|uniref:hypothetical protein n=1 Tax=unclassified Streptomyces TaxID=2593676 RepID=UPI00341748B6
MSDTFWTAVSAIGGVAAFAAITWQAVLTRSTLRVTQDTALEAVRARLDSAAPMVTVQIAAPPWPPLAWAPSGKPVQPWPEGHLFEFPEKKGLRIVLQQAVTIANSSASRVEVRVTGDLVETDDETHRLRRPELLLLEAGQSAELHLMGNFTVGELAENYQARQSDQQLPHRVTASVSVHDGRDNGTTDIWELQLTGCPVQPHSSRDSVWIVVPYHITEGEGLRSLDYSLLPPRRRIHWISRAADRRLPEPPLR